MRLALPRLLEGVGLPPAERAAALQRCRLGSVTRSHVGHLLVSPSGGGPDRSNAACEDPDVQREGGATAAPGNRARLASRPTGRPATAPR